MLTRKTPSPHAPTPVFGAKYTPPQPLTEQRTHLSFWQRMPMPGRDMELLQAALLRTPMRTQWGFVATLAVSAISAVALVRML